MGNLNFQEFQQMLIQQNANRRLDEGNESSKQGELVALYFDQYKKSSSCYPILGIRIEKEPMACCAYGVTKNPNLSPPHQLYARIDIVIVNRILRRQGWGRVLVYTALDQIMDQWGEKIYSISSLCAHKGMRKILESVGGFGFNKDQQKQTWDGTLDVTPSALEKLKTRLKERLPASIKSAQYRLRQSR